VCVSLSLGVCVCVCVGRSVGHLLIAFSFSPFIHPISLPVNQLMHFIVQQSQLPISGRAIP